MAAEIGPRLSASLYVGRITQTPDPAARSEPEADEVRLEGRLRAAVDVVEGAVDPWASLASSSRRARARGMTAARRRGHGRRTTMSRENDEVPTELLAWTTTRYVPGLTSAPDAVRPFQVQPWLPAPSGFAVQMVRTTVVPCTIDSVTAAPRRRAKVTRARLPCLRERTTLRDHVTDRIVRSTVTGISRIVRLPARSRPRRP